MRNFSCHSKPCLSVTSRRSKVSSSTLKSERSLYILFVFNEEDRTSSFECYTVVVAICQILTHLFIYLHLFLQKVDVIVRKKHQTGLEVSILPEEMPALLPTVHLSDHVTNCPLMWAGLQEGDIISNAVCLSRNKEMIVSSWAHLLLFQQRS